MLWKVWLEFSDFKASILIECSDLNEALNRARALASLHHAKLLCVDNVHSGMAMRDGKDARK